MTIQLRFASLLLIVGAIGMPSASLAQNNKAPPAASAVHKLAPLKVAGKPTTAQLRTVSARVNASAAARKRFAEAAAKGDNQGIAAALRSVNVVLPTGTTFNTVAARPTGGGGGGGSGGTKEQGGKCYELTWVGGSNGKNVIKLVPVKCPPPLPCSDLSCI